MAADAGKLKSILKPSSHQNQSHRDIALHHARILQHRKDLEAQILESVILLSEFPLVRDDPYCASHPSPSDAAAFKSHVRLFRPSDYEDLIEERNINGLCAYALCARPRPAAGRGGKWALRSGGEIVKREELAMWCSVECKKRALYVRVQLNETAAWERAGMPEIRIDLLDETATGTDADQAAQAIERLKLENHEKAARNSAALAIERGESPGSAPNLSKVKVTVQEKDVQAPGEQPITGSADDYRAVEGYRSKLDMASRTRL